MQKITLTVSFILLIHSTFAGRLYDPEFGRWLNRDPIGVEGGINIYNSVSNSMVNGFSGGLAYSGGMEKELFELIWDFGVDFWGFEKFKKPKFIGFSDQQKKDLLRYYEQVYNRVQEIRKEITLMSKGNKDLDIGKVTKTYEGLLYNKDAGEKQIQEAFKNFRLVIDWIQHNFKDDLTFTCRKKGWDEREPYASTSHKSNNINIFPYFWDPKTENPVPLRNSRQATIMHELAHEASGIKDIFYTITSLKFYRERKDLISISKNADTYALYYDKVAFDSNVNYEQEFLDRANEIRKALERLKEQEKKLGNK